MERLQDPKSSRHHVLRHCEDNILHYRLAGILLADEKMACTGLYREANNVWPVHIGWGCGCQQSGQPHPAGCSSWMGFVYQEKKKDRVAAVLMAADLDASWESRIWQGRCKMQVILKQGAAATHSVSGALETHDLPQECMS